MQLTDVDGNALTSAGLVPYPVEKLRIAERGLEVEHVGIDRRRVPFPSAPPHPTEKDRLLKITAPPHPVELRFVAVCRLVPPNPSGPKSAFALQLRELKP